MKISDELTLYSGDYITISCYPDGSGRQAFVRTMEEGDCGVYFNTSDKQVEKYQVEVNNDTITAIWNINQKKLFFNEKVPED